jgi:hypothetical protein
VMPAAAYPRASETILGGISLTPASDGGWASHSVGLATVRCMYLMDLILLLAAVDQSSPPYVRNAS